MALIIKEKMQEASDKGDFWLKTKSSSFFALIRDSVITTHSTVWRCLMDL